ncbi:MAG: murein biosynthesis integral membrane protein MurJ [Chloroflexi bacterium]|nr:MAG: murein biosynthesis integral membrane protein MurJ [Chloroflexota bacterium]
MILTKRQIAKVTGVVMIAFVTSRLLGLTREIIIGYRFGTSGELDAYLAAFRLPDLIFQIIAGGALGSAFIPTFSTYLAQGDEKGAWELASSMLNLLLAVLIPLCGAAALLAPALVSKVIAPGFDHSRQALTASLMRLMLITPVVFGVSSLTMAILNSYQHFTMPAFAPSAYNLCIILGALVLACQWGIYGLVWGVVLGAFAHLLVQIPALLRKPVRYIPSLDWRNPGVREVVRLMLPRMVGLAAVQVNFLVNVILASGLAPGSIAALNYAWLLMLLPQGIFAQAIATAIFPTFSHLAALEEAEELRSLFASVLKGVLFLSLPATVGLIVLRVPLVQMLWQRGAFGLKSTYAVAWALQFYALGLFAHSVVEVTVRVFYALHDTLTPVKVGLGAMGLNIALSLALLRIFRLIGWEPFGGLALANSLATIVEMTLLLLLLEKRIKGFGGGLAEAIGRMAFSSLAMGIGLWIVDGYLRRGGTWVEGLGGIATGLLLYSAISLKFSRGTLMALFSAYRHQ